MENCKYIEVYAFDNMADKIYAKLKNGDYILIEGKIRDNGKVEVLFWKCIKVAQKNYQR